MTAFGCGAMVGGFLGGQLSDRFGFFNVQFFSLCFSGILFILLGAMKTMEQIIICVFVLSVVGEAFRPANAAAIAAYSSGQNRTRSYSLNRLAINIGWSAGPAIGGALASISYSLLFWVDGITCIIASLILYIFLVPKKTKQAEQVSFTTVNSPYKDKIFLKGMFLLLLVGICFFQLFNTIPVFYKQQVHLSEATIGWVLALNGIIIAFIEMVLVYKLEGKQKASVYIAIGCLLMGISFLVMILDRSLVVIVSAMLFVTFGEMLLFPFINDFWVSRTNKQNRGQYAAMFTMSFALAQIISPILSTQIAMTYGFNWLWLVNFILCCVAATGFLFILKRTSNG
jgi:predicted MFS family arabinose efflux permease